MATRASNTVINIKQVPSSFAQANAAYSSANNVAPQVQPAFNQANASFTHANAAYSSANNVAPQVQPAFDKANAAFNAANNVNVYNANTTSTSFFSVPVGNTAQRPANPLFGSTRYNTDINGLEVYSATGWTPLAAPPSISTVSPATFNGDSGTPFTILGTNFTQDASVYFLTSNGTVLIAGSVNIVSTSQIIATTPRNIKVEEEPISVRVTQQSGTTTKLDCIDSGGLPTWTTSAGTLGSTFGANTVNVYVSATDPDGSAVSYQLVSGSLPNGVSLTSANGLIQGLANSVTSNTTYNFIIKANDTVNNNADRTFSYTILNRAPVINTAAGLISTFYSGNAVPTTTISAYDPDGASITFTAPTGNIVNTFVGSANGTIIGSPIVVLTNTTYTIGVVATDVGGLTASNNYSFTVLNRPPVINTAAGSLGSIFSGNSINTSINAYDPDGGTLTYAVTSGTLPPNTSLGSANGVIQSSNILVTRNTTNTFTVTVTDQGNDIASNTYTYTILNRPPVFANAAGSLGSIYDSERDSYSLIVSAPDPDGSPVTYSITSGSLPSGMTLNSNGVFTGTVSSHGANTTYNFTVTASDGESSNSRAFSVTVFAPITVDITVSSNITYGSATTTNTISFVSPSSRISTLRIMGGGSGGASGYQAWAPGGGGGGYMQINNIPVTKGQTYTLLIGRAGGGGRVCAGPGYTGTPGGNTSAFGYTAFGAIGAGVVAWEQGGPGGSTSNTGTFGGSVVANTAGSPGNYGVSNGGGGNSGGFPSGFGGAGAPASGNFTAGVNGGLGAGGGGGPSCQNGHIGGGDGGGGRLLITY
jgi:hypothetical protein